MTTGREWPTREQWQADAERFVRHACYPRERVSEIVADWAPADEREQLVHVARNARLAAGRVARMLADPDARLLEVGREMAMVLRLARMWADVEHRAEVAADQAVEEAVAAETERRATDEAWANELQRRAAIDGDWVLPARNAR